MKRKLKKSEIRALLRIIEHSDNISRDIQELAEDTGRTFRTVMAQAYQIKDKYAQISSDYEPSLSQIIYDIKKERGEL